VTSTVHGPWQTGDPVTVQFWPNSDQPLSMFSYSGQAHTYIANASKRSLNLNTITALARPTYSMQRALKMQECRTR